MIWRIKSSQDGFCLNLWVCFNSSFIIITADISEISPISDATVFPLYGHIIDLLCDSSLNICVFFLGKLCAAHCSPFLWPHYWCEKTVEFQACRSHFLHFPHVAKVALPVCGAVLMQRREHTHRCDQRQYRVMDVMMSASRINYQIIKR